MDASTFSAHGPGQAVGEPVKAEAQPPEGLTAAEQALYRRLYDREKGRLEQEFLPVERVHAELARWRGS